MAAETKCKLPPLPIPSIKIGIVLPPLPSLPIISLIFPCPLDDLDAEAA